MNKTIVITALVFGILAIILGAFGAHGLKKVLAPEALETFETGVKYQMYHALFLLILGGTNFVADGAKRTVFYLIVIGVIFFSFSIYGLATNKLTPFDFKKIALITPVGGLFLILGWAYLLFAVLTKK
ncbi:hypothetical protein BUL40_02860 [Croceivirga radicis]|uniref:DUF423 domain-containing protein n=1 Tax=Croceivirga radicis TaxID=1929488 RepID=A0A1V6LWN7_9FLAO|nr:DUF423 domain-containing protein [Croceivirga radicis]OQD44507.1 hypothetical protein BUL40_02860 [Croceivirga radicis]